MIHVLLCAYDEERDVRSLLLELARVLGGGAAPWCCVLVDDGSRDRTAAEACAAQEELGEALRLEIISKAVNGGLGAALATGLAVCCRNAAPDDVIVTLDADNTHRPSQIPQLLAALEGGFDVAIASRYAAGAVVAGVPVHRRWLSDLGGAFLRLLLPIQGVHDYTCCFRAYRASVLQRAFATYGDRFIEQSGFSAVADILLRLRPLEVRAVEVPLSLDYGPRVGASKMRVASSTVEMLRLAIRRRLERPWIVSEEAA